MTQISFPIKLIVIAIILLFSSTYTFSQLSIATANTNYIIDFDATVSGVNNDPFTGSGFQSTPTAGQLDSDAWAITGFSDGDLAFGGTQTTASTDYTRGTHSGGAGTGGIYAFEVSASNFALGVQPGADDFTSGSIILKINNNTGGAIDNLIISYKVYIYNDQERSNSFNFSYSADNATYTDVGNLDIISIEVSNDNPEWMSYFKNYTITGINVANGSSYYLKWIGDDDSGSGSRDEFALDDIKIAYSTNDLTTEVSGSTNIPANTISSLVDTPSEAISVLNLNFEEGSNSDGVSTFITNIRVYPHTSNTASWLQNIQGARLYDGSVYYTPMSATITDNYMDLEFSSSALELANGTGKNFDLQIYLNTSNITDDGILSFMVDADNHSFATDPSGSIFASTFGGGDFYSNDFTIEISATEMQFKTQAQNVIINTNFNPAPVVALTDANGNIDLGYAGATIRMTSTGTIIGTIEENIDASSGLATFSAIQMSVAETAVTLTATDHGDVIGSSENITSNSFDVYDTPSLIISEVHHPSDTANAKYIELYNTGASAINFGSEVWYLSKQTNGGTWSEVQLDVSKSIAAGDTYTVAYSSTTFPLVYDYPADQYQGTVVNINGNDAVFLYKGGDHSTGALVDIYGEIDTDGTGQDWEYTESVAFRRRSVTEPSSTWDASEWLIYSNHGAHSGTPGGYAEAISWTGSLGTGYDNRENWNPSTYPPDITFDVTITNQANTPSGTGGFAYNLTIENDAVLINYAGCFIVDGTIVNNAGVDGFQFLSNLASPATLLYYTDNVEASINSMFGFTLNVWFLVAPPVSEDSAEVFMGEYLDEWDEPTESWIDILDSSTVLNTMQGYSVKKTSLYAEYQGKMRAGEFSKVLDYTSGAAYPSPEDDYTGWNLIGNPYPSNIDWDLVSIPADMDGGVSIWDSDGDTYYQYSALGGGDAEAHYVLAGQGFFVKATDVGVTFTLSDAVRTRKGDGASIDKAITDALSRENSLRISAKGNDKSDNAYINFIEESHLYYDPLYDVHKLFGRNHVPQIFSYADFENDEKVAINSIPFPQLDDVVPLGFRVNTPGNYQLEFNGIYSFNILQPFFLLDKVSEQVYDLKVDSIINFDYQNSDPENRFDLVFDFITEVEEMEDVSEKEKVWNISSIKDRLFIQSENDQEGEVQIFNIQGQLVYSSSTIHSFQSGVNLKLPPAYYLVKLVSGKNVQVGKVFIL